MWTHDAEQRLHRIPAFIRGRVKMAVERHAQSNGKAEITPAEMTATLEGMGRRIPFKRPQGVGQTKEGDGSADAG